jgi:hypothetical protein
MQMLVYNYDATTGVCLGTSQADESPLEPKTYHVPAHATTVAPPNIPSGHVAVWDENTNEWNLTEDHIGETVYYTSNAGSQVIISLGAVPEGCTTLVPPDYPAWDATTARWKSDLAAIITAKYEAIQTEKCRTRDAGFEVDGVHFDSDQAARMSYMEFAMEIAANPTYSKDWKASEGVWVTMDATLFAKVKAVGEAYMTAAFNWQKARDAELAAIKVAVAAGTMTEEAAKAAVAAVSATYTA